MEKTNNFCIHKMLERWSRWVNARRDTRKLLSPAVLCSTGVGWASLCTDSFEVLLFHAAFFGTFRISELVAVSHHDTSDGALGVGIRLSSSKVQITLYHFKTNQLERDSLIVLVPFTEPALCQVAALHYCSACRDTGDSNFFVHCDDQVSVLDVYEESPGEVGTTGV